MNFQQLSAVKQGLAEITMTHHESKDGALPRLSILIYTRGVDAGILIVVCDIDGHLINPVEVKSSGCFANTKLPEPVSYDDSGLLLLVQRQLDSITL